MSPELENPSEQPEMRSATTAQPNPTPSAAPEPAFGWTQYAEILNGRFAMLGFVALLILEFFTHQDFFTWVGLR
jgi:hypothetical protein